MLNELRDGGASPSCDGTVLEPVKKEPLTENQKLHIVIREWLGNLKDKVTKVSSLEMEIREPMAKRTSLIADPRKYSQTLHTHCERHHKLLTKLLDLLKKVMSEAPDKDY